MDNHDSDIL